ncbi:hypothetical protein J2785_000713 [Burkholderia ambifaria]|nr:hypothetical protein [Burkholderia ambifaria]
MWRSIIFLPRFQSDACSGNRTMPVPRRSGDNVPCSPERGGCAALRRRIPADCVLAGTDRIRCRTGRTSRRRLSYVHIRKERASFARAHPHKGFGARDDGRNGCGMPEVANLKHAARGMRRRVAAEPCGIRLNNRHGIFTGRHRSDRPDSPRKFAWLPTRNVSCALHAVGGIGAAGRARAGLVVTMLLARGTAMLGLARAWSVVAVVLCVPPVTFVLHRLRTYR